MEPSSKRDAWRDERVAAEYEERRFRTPLQRLKHRRDERLVLALLDRTAGVRSVLDLPCGTGRLVPGLVASGRFVVGADVSLEMMRAGRRARAELASKLVQAEAERLPFRDGAFDAVVGLRFLFHLGPDERRSILSEMRRVAYGGVVVGEVRYRGTLKHFGRWLRSRVLPTPRYRPSEGRRAIERELGEAGLELVTLRPVSRTFSDKALFLARSAANAAPRSPSSESR